MLVFEVGFFNFIVMEFGQKHRKSHKRFLLKIKYTKTIIFPNECPPEGVVFHEERKEGKTTQRYILHY